VALETARFMAEKLGHHGIIEKHEISRRATAGTLGCVAAESVWQR
jgi:hypothetical protein